MAADLSHRGIAKAHTNQEDAYQHRSIDDVMAALSPLLARHKLCVLPQILERTDRQSSSSTHVMVRAAFELVSALDGSSHTLETFGEAIEEFAGSELMKRALGEHIFPRYIELKRREWDEYRVQVTEWEKEKYLAAL